MKFEINSLYWDNGKHLVKSHTQVMNHFDLPINYYNLNGVHHGLWMNYVLENSTSDIVGFIENDCVPLNREIVDYSIDYVSKSGTFIGCAQVANHIPPFDHIYAAPCFYFISREFWNDIGKPSFLETPRSDVAEEISRLADENKLTYKALYPTHFERSPEEGIWKLSNYGYYGIGTVFADSVYHLYQGRHQQNADLYKLRCEQIVNGTFSTESFNSSTEYYNGKVF
jgi:hypothetical protein